jgi:hypothetical protein
MLRFRLLKDGYVQKQVATLTYDAETEKLTGTIGKERAFSITAYSGGSRGHKEVNPGYRREIQAL